MGMAWINIPVHTITNFTITTTTTTTTTAAAAAAGVAAAAAAGVRTDTLTLVGQCAFNRRARGHILPFAGLAGGG